MIIKGYWFSREDIVIIGAVCFTVLSVYTATLSPSIAGGDSGEIVAEGCHLGTAHPPGYPLITLIINALSKFSLIGSVAYRVNIFCALCTVLSGFFIAKVVKSFHVKSIAGSVFSIGMFSFSPLIWQYAVTAEVFPLNTLFAAVIIYLVRLFTKYHRLNHLYFGAFISGLALCNQHTIVLFEAPLILWLLFIVRRWIMHDYKILIKLSGFFLLGLSPYLYLPIFGSLYPKMGSWGHVSTLGGFLHHFLRRDYGTFQLFSGRTGRPTEGMVARTEAYIADMLFDQGLYIVLPLAIFGMMFSVMNDVMQPKLKRVVSVSSLRKKDKKTSGKKILPPSDPDEAKLLTDSAKVREEKTVKAAVFTEYVEKIVQRMEDESRWTSVVFILTLFFYFFVFHSLANLPLSDRLLFGVHQRFWMQPNVIVFLFAGVGFDGLLEIIKYSILFFFIGKEKSKKGKTTPKKSENINKEEKETEARRVSKLTDKIGRIVNYTGLFIAISLAYLQYSKWVYFSDSSENVHFRNYASAVLEPLPENAILFINYDQQWTSVRYMQVCEGFRTDVTAIQLSMMTYPWFQYKRELYSNITFPGKYHTYPGNPNAQNNQGFTLLQFLQANPRREVYLGGKFSYSDPQLRYQYDLVPVGLLVKFVPMTSSPDGNVYSQWRKDSWAKVAQHLYRLPDINKYNTITWEWTIVRDFKDRVTDTAAYMLLAALKVTETDHMPLIEAVYWLEVAVWYESLHPTDSRALPSLKNCPTSLLKNVGLAHVHLGQNKIITIWKELSAPEDIFLLLKQLKWPTTGWRLWSLDRFILYWGEFLSREDAKSDSQYNTILGMYQTVVEKKGESDQKPLEVKEK